MDIVPLELKCNSQVRLFHCIVLKQKNGLFLSGQSIESAVVDCRGFNHDVMVRWDDSRVVVLSDLFRFRRHAGHLNLALGKVTRFVTAFAPPLAL